MPRSALNTCARAVGDDASSGIRSSPRLCLRPRYSPKRNGDSVVAVCASCSRCSGPAMDGKRAVPEKAGAGSGDTRSDGNVGIGLLS